MKQVGTQKFASEDGKFILICENDTSLGALHDYLLSLKGTVVDLINKAQKQEQEASDKVKEQEAEEAEKAEETEEVKEAE